MVIVIPYSLNDAAYTWQGWMVGQEVGDKNKE